MRGTGWALSMVAMCGCGFEVTTSGAVVDAGPEVDASPDAMIEVDAAPDAPPIERRLFAVSETTLYEVDVDNNMAQVVGTITEGQMTHRVGGLAFDGTNLLGLSGNGAELLVIDPSTAAVTARRAISPASTYYGLTVAPAGEAGPTAVVFAGASGGKLARIDAATGVATSIGEYGGGMYFYTDLAWVGGAGLFITLQGGSCTPRCFARLDPTTGAATPIRTDMNFMVYGLSGYRGMLWALHNTGHVTLVNQTNGLMTTDFNPGIAWTEAAQ